MNTQLFWFLLSVFLTQRVYISAQTDPEYSVQLEQKMEQNAGSGEEEVDLTELTEILAELLRRPLNLNKANTEELRETGLLNELQIVNLLKHRQHFGPLISIHELQVVPGFSEEFVRQIIPYCTAGRNIDDPNASFLRMVKDGKHQIIARTQWVNEEKKGYSKVNGNPVYMGSPQSIYVRYRFQFMKKLSWGFVADKDAGEQFFKGSQKRGFDFYSGHFALHKTGIMNLLVAGDYQLEYGQGLTLWSGMSGGKSSDPSMLCKYARGIKPYTSSNEALFRRGVAISLKKRNMVLDGFVSSRKLDGNTAAASDSVSSAELFTSIQESGYHRTDNELAGKNAIKEFMYGGHAGYRGRNFRAGITVCQTRFNLPFMKNMQPYNQFEFKGRSLFNAGGDYSFLLRNINLFGEVTMSGNGAVAFLNGAVMSLDPRLTVSLMHRSYPRNFNTLTASAFRESGNNFNEQGIYGGINFRPVRVLNITCNFDHFYFPWLRYRTDAPGGGYEFSALISYKPDRKSELYMRYRESSKMINGSGNLFPSGYPVPVFQRGLRIHLTSKVSKLFTLRTRVEWVNFNLEEREERGFMVFQDIQFHPMSFPLSFNLRYALFDTDSYDSRIYAYENDVLYGYSIPAYYYKGSRIYFNARVKICKGLDAWLRYAATFYTNKKVIGSGYEEIRGSRKSEIKMQLRLEF